MAFSRTRRAATAPQSLLADESFPGAGIAPTRTDRSAARYWSDNLTALLSDRLALTTVRPRPAGAASPDPALDTVLAPGWYEVATDPFSVRWWSGYDWVGQPVPLVASMLQSPPPAR